MLKSLIFLIFAFETVKFYPINVGGTDFISYRDIADFIKCKSFVSDSTVELLDGTKRITLDFVNKRGRLGKETISLENLHIDDHTLYLDAETWGYLLSWFSENQKYYWDYNQKRYIVSKYPPSVKEFNIAGDSLYISYNVDLSPLVFQSGDTLYIRIQRGFYSGLSAIKVYGEYVKFVRIRHTSEGVTFLVTLNEAVKYTYKQVPTRISFKFSRELPTLVAKETPVDTIKYEPAPGIKPSESYERKVRVVIIDPGHGGQDPGAVANGVKEKDVVLSVARLVKKRLEKMGIKVILTRDADYFVTLGERARIAQKNNADLFVSIHCNYAPNSKTARGMETYFLSEARTDWERSVAAFENSVVKFEAGKKYQNGDILTMILGDMAQYEFLKESQDLAYFVQESLINNTGGTVDRGVKQAGFYVLKGVYAPSILVELGFLTNRDEARRLTDLRYQEKLADAIVDGIIKFKVSYERGKK